MAALPFPPPTQQGGNMANCPKCSTMLVVEAEGIYWCPKCEKFWSDADVDEAEIIDEEGEE